MVEVESFLVYITDWVFGDKNNVSQIIHDCALLSGLLLFFSSTNESSRARHLRFQRREPNSHLYAQRYPLISIFRLYTGNQ
jgi:hypothetical protein